MVRPAVGIVCGLLCVGLQMGCRPKSVGPLATETPIDVRSVGPVAQTPTGVASVGPVAEAPIDVQSVGPPAQAPIHVTPAMAAAKASNRLGFDLYAHLRTPDQNLIFSPISASIALAMAAAGANGKTLGEMSHVLHVDALSDAHGAFADLLGSLPISEEKTKPPVSTSMPDAPRPPTQPQLQVANRVWGQKLAYNEDFLSLLRDRYRASFGVEDFAHAPEKARAHINAWISDRTRGTIPDLLPRGSIGAQTQLVLTNAVYFKGTWVNVFDVGKTHDEDFRRPAGTVRASVIRVTTDFQYARVEGLQILELPYEGSVSMIVFLPDGDDGLADVERRVALHYDAWVSALASRRVDLWLPKWRVTQTFLLNDALQTLGMPLAFTPEADFSKMTGAATLHIEGVIQRAFVETDERGTEAAAATAAIIVAISATPVPPKPVVFHADHPFLYVIRDRETGVILFAGRIVNPADRS
jgi:serpin B